MATARSFNLDFEAPARRLSQTMHEELVDAAKIRTIKRGAKYPTKGLVLEDLVKKSGDYATNITR